MRYELGRRLWLCMYPPLIPEDIGTLRIYVPLDWALKQVCLCYNMSILIENLIQEIINQCKRKIPICTKKYNFLQDKTIYTTQKIISIRHQPVELPKKLE